MIAFDRLSPLFGVETADVDLSQALSDAAFDELERAFYAHQVLALRGQRITPAQFSAFARRIGPPQPHVIDQFHHPDDPDILILSNVRKDGRPTGLQDAGSYFHTDYSYLQVPARATALYSRVVPRVGGDTLFANQLAAYDDLSGAMKKRIDPLLAIHHYGNRNDVDEASRTAASALSAEQKAKLPLITHRIARPHPVTGRKALYAVSGSSFGIVGMPDDEARDLLDELAAHSTRPEYQLRFKYGVGDIVVWDNAALLHSATLTDPGDARTLWRITVLETSHGAVAPAVLAPTYTTKPTSRPRHMASLPLPTPPIAPMLAKIADALPGEPGFLFEPKWDGFRAIVFRTPQQTLLQSRDGKPLNRYFPELERALHDALPKGCVLDGEIVVASPRGLDFDALQQRIHPAASRIEKLARETPSRFVAFDLLGAGGRSTMELPQAERRTRLERLLGSAQPPLHLTPMTRDRAAAERWLQQFEGAGLDGVIAKLEAAVYQPGKRAMLKIKHSRTADCVVAGFRGYKDRSDAVGSLLLGLYDNAGVLQHVGVASSFTTAMRQQLLQELAPLRKGAIDSHPWRDWAGAVVGDAQRMPGAQSRWSGGKDLSWQPLRPERVCEVKYDHLQGNRFRHATVFLRWRPDKPPQDCRYDQLEVTMPYELARVFGA